MTVQDASLSRFLTVLFRRWEERSLPYLVLRNYEALPETTSNDVDVLVDPASLGDAARLLRVVADETGWMLHNVAEFACTSVYLFNPDTLEQVHIDLMGGIRWHFLQYGDHRRLLDARSPCRGFFIPAPAHEAAINLMTRLLYGGYVRDKYRDGIQNASIRDKGSLREFLAPWIGVTLASSFSDAAARGDWRFIEARTASARMMVLRANLRRPVQLAARVLADIGRLTARWVRAPGLCIVFAGPDGCGKTSVANGVAQALSATFSPERTAHYHWKPVRPKNVSTQPSVDPHGTPPRSLVPSLFFFAYHYTAFFFGWWLHVKPVLFKNGLVMIDRYYYDFHVDLLRYRLTLPNWVVRVGFLLIRKPDLVFLLDAPTEVLQARKAEVSPEECTRQRKAYRAVVDRQHNGHIIDASQQLPNVIGQVSAAVLAFMKRRYERTSRFHRVSHEQQ